MRKKTKIINVRLTEEDWTLIKKMCKKNGTWSGSWVRTLVLKELVRIGKRANDDPHIREKVQ
jgi:predicted DNA binding CopG/RHH family protein